MQKKVYWTNFVQFWILYSDIFFLVKIPYLNYQINFQSSHLTKKETEDASKRLSSYCMGALNCRHHCELFWFPQTILDNFEYFDSYYGICNFKITGLELTEFKFRVIKFQNDALDLLNPTRLKECFVSRPVNVSCHIDSSRHRYNRQSIV